MNTYEKQATDFLEKTGTTMTVEFKENGKHFEGDKENRDIYNVKFKRGNRSFTIQFGQSLIKSTKIVDTKTGNEFTTNGACLKGNLIIVDMDRFRSGLGRQLKEVKGTPPTAYDVITCLQKYDVGSFEDFCGDFGYDTDSRTARKTYKAVVKEYDNVCKIWTDEEIEDLQEIQ
jgi:hypothetical protein